MSEPTISDLIESMVVENKTLKARIERLEKVLRNTSAALQECTRQAGYKENSRVQEANAALEEEM
jgi:regulator of replication initiation timing